MSIFEKFRKAEQEDKAKAAQASGKEKIEGPTTKEILADKEQSRLFGEYLGKQGKKVFGEKIISGQLLPDEVDELSLDRQGFLETMESAKAMREQLSSKDIEAIVASWPELQKIADSVGSESVRELISRDVERLAIEDPDNFNRIDKAVENFESTEAAIKENSKKISEICTKYGIPEADYLTAVRDGENPSAVYDLVKSHMGNFKKLFSKKSTIDAEIEGVKDLSEDLKGLSSDYDGRLRGIAGALRLTITGNKNVWNALVADMQGQRVERPEKEMAFSEVMSEPLDRVEIQSEWEFYKRDHQSNPGFNEAQAKMDFASEYLDKNVTKKKKGFWSVVGKAIWESFIQGSLK